MSKFFNIRQYSCLFMMIMMALALLLSACTPGDDPVDPVDPVDPDAPTTCPEGDTTCISVFEATSELNKAKLTVLNKLGIPLPLAYNVRVHVVPNETTDTLLSSDDHPVAEGTATVDGEVLLVFGSGLGLNWVLVDTALANNASETAIIEVTTTLTPGDRLLACLYANNDITANPVIPSSCKKLDSVDLVMSTTDTETNLTVGLNPNSPGGLDPSKSGGLFYLNAKLKNAGTLEYVPPTDTADITGIDVYREIDDTAVHTTYPTEADRTDKLITNSDNEDHLTSNIASGAIHDTNVAFHDLWIHGSPQANHNRQAYACVARVAKEFYIHNNCYYTIIDTTHP